MHIAKQFELPVQDTRKVIAKRKARRPLRHLALPMNEVQEQWAIRVIEGEVAKLEKF